MQELYLGEQKYHTSYISEKNELLLKKKIWRVHWLIKAEVRTTQLKKKNLLSP